MIIKFIECTPVLGKESAFSQAQETWASISECNGFISQYGGWNNNSTDAIILSLWDSQSSVDEFMFLVHDSISENNFQHQTYEQCIVHYLTVEHFISTPKYLKPNDIGFIHISDYKLKQNSKKHFLKDQLTIWNQTMASCSGILGGYVAKYNEVPDRYMLVSLWCNKQSHAQYVSNRFQLVRCQVNSKAYIDDLVDYQILTVRDWSI